MATRQDIGDGLRKLLLPAAASVSGAGAGLIMTRKPVRKAMPDFRDLDFGELTDDLRAKLDSVIGKGQSAARSARSSSSGNRRLDPDELEKRRSAREQRRSRRRASVR